MATAAELQVRFTATGAQQVQGEIAKTGSAVQKFGGITATVGKAAVAGFLGIGAAAAVGLGMATKVALGYEKELANVNSLLQLTDADLAKVDARLLKVAQNPGITQAPAQLAQGLYQAISSGYSDVNDALLIVESSAKAATAGQTTTEVAVSAATAVMNAYGMAATDVNHVNDLMFQTVNDGVVTYEQLANNMGQVLPLASQLGVPFEQLGAAYAVATQQGIGVSQAETGIANVMKAALNPTDSLTAAVQAHGYATAADAIQTEGLNGFLGILQEEAGGSDEKLFDMLGTMEGVNMALALGSEENLPKYNEELGKMEHASDGVGAAQKALEKQMRSSAFAIAKAKQSVQILAIAVGGLLTPAIGAAARGLTSFITKGVLPFIDVLGKAFSGGNAFRELVEQFPEPLQRAIGAFGSIAEAIGDVARAFGDRGLMGAINTLFQGGELQQIGAAFGAIADEAWEAVQAGFNAIPWGDVWDIVVMGIQGAASVGIDILDWTVNVGAPALGGWLADQAGSLHDWLQGKIFGGTVGDGTGGPESDSGGVGGMVFDIAQITLKVLAAVADISAVDVRTAIQNTIDDAKTLASETYEWAVVIGLVPEFNWTGGAGGGSGGGAGGGGGPRIPLVPWLDEQVGDQTWYQKLKMVLQWEPSKENSDSLQAKVQGVLDGIEDLKVGTVREKIRSALQSAVDFGNINPLEGLGGKISGWLSSAFSFLQGDAGLGSDLSNLGVSQGSPITSMITDWITGEIDNLKGKVSGWKDSIVSAIKEIMPGSIPDLKFPSIDIDLGPLHTVVDFAIDQLTKLKEKLLNAFNDFQDVVTQTSSASTTTPGASGPTQQAEREGTTGEDLLEDGKKDPLVTIDADNSKARAKFAEIETLGTTLAAKVFSGKLDFDTGPAAVKYTDAFSWGTTFAGTTFTGTLDLNNGPAAVKYTDAFSWGTVWQGTTFTSTFDINTGPAAVAYTSAFGWGYAWASQVFTASFSIDTSGLYAALAVAQSVAASIAALMPHSPAKEGPLKEPISFQYIADDMARAMGGMPSMAKRSMSLVRDAVTAKNKVAMGYGFAGGGASAGGGYAGGGAVIQQQHNGPRYYGSVTVAPPSLEAQAAFSQSAIRRGRP